MYNWKAGYSFIQCFFQIIWKITIFRIIKQIVWLKIAIFAKTTEGLHNSDLI